MQRMGPQGFSGLATLVVAGAVGLPVLTGAAEPALPRVLWTAAYVLYLAALLAAAFVRERSPAAAGVFSCVVVSAWAVVFGAPRAGLLPVLLVVAVALSVYLVPLWAGLTVAALNTVFLAAVFHLDGADGVELATGTSFYLLIQLASLFSSSAILGEQRMGRELAEANVRLRASSVLLEQSARTAERLRISRELHDVIGHQLTILALELEAARHLDGDGARSRVERANRVARELLSDVRSTVGGLRSPAGDLPTMLRQVTRDLPGLTVHVEVDPAVRADEEQSAALVRAVQEIATNTLRHAQATTLRIRVAEEDGGIVLDALDDGRGGTPAPGNGLRGLSERFEALGGAVEVDGTGGFRLTVRVPAP